MNSEMNSLEALDNLVHCKSITKCKECRHKNLCTMERDYNIIKQDLDRLEELEEILDILRHNTNISKNGKGFTISIWLNTENCDMPSCSNLEELLKVFRVLKEKKVLIDTYSKEVFGND